jgi:methionyl-tRNA formyltransferase
VKARALTAAIPVVQPDSLKDPEFLDQIRMFAPDCLVVVAFRILPRELFALPKLGSFNVHPSLLPRGRGPAPLRWTLLRGERETGVSIIQLTEQIDGGGILAQERTAVGEHEDYGALHDRLGKLGAQMLVRVLDDVDRGAKLTPIGQDETLVTKAPKLLPGDYRIDWTKRSAEILRLIRAAAPAPGASAKAADVEIKILMALPDAGRQLTPGELVQVQQNLWVGTGDCAIRLEQVKPAGRKAMSIAEYLRGRPKLPPKFDLQ